MKNSYALWKNTDEEGGDGGDHHLVSNGSLDFRGNPADKRRTGRWKASPFILANEFAESLAFFAVAIMIGTYLVVEMHQTIPESAAHVNDWMGASYGLTIVGAFLADSYLGRFRTIVIFSCVYTLGMVLLTISASKPSLSPSPGEPASPYQSGFLYTSLALVVIGMGGIKPSVASFGGDQFDEADEEEVQQKHSYFSWFYFMISNGALVAITVLVYLTTKLGWGWGFSIPGVFMAISVIVVTAGMPFYRYQKPTGSAFTRFAQVVVSAVMKHFQGVSPKSNGEDELFEVKSNESDIKGARKLQHTEELRFLDKAAMLTDSDVNDLTNRWRICTVTQVEEFKTILRVLPIWATTIALSISYAQLSSFFISQAHTLDLTITPSFSMPASSAAIFSASNSLIWVPLYECLIVPCICSLTGKKHGLTPLQRIGTGLFCSILAMLAASFVERRRLNTVALGEEPMSVFWLFPQFFLMGTGEFFAYVGQLEFFYNEASDGTRSISNALFLSEIGIGNWISSLIVRAVVSFSGGEEGGWLRNDLNKSRLDMFYGMLMAINVVNFVVYLVVAKRYKKRTN